MFFGTFPLPLFYNLTNKSNSSCQKKPHVLTSLVPVSLSPLQAHDSPVRAMTWSHNDMWMLTADHGGYVKYWQSNMNNVKMFQAHKEAIREARFIPNLPFSVVNLSLCCLLSALQYHAAATRGCCLTTCHTMLLWLINDRCKCVLLQHCSDLLLTFYLMWLMSCLSVCTQTVDCVE